MIICTNMEPNNATNLYIYAKFPFGNREAKKKHRRTCQSWILSGRSWQFEDQVVICAESQCVTMLQSCIYIYI